MFPAPLRCAPCQFENPSGMRFCGQCGRALAAVCPQCGAGVPSGFKPASAWFHLTRPLVLGEESSPLVHATSAADLASGTSAIVDIRAWSFVNADLTLVLWRDPRPPWILLDCETHTTAAPVSRTACCRISTGRSAAASRH